MLPYTGNTRLLVLGLGLGLGGPGSRLRLRLHTTVMVRYRSPAMARTRDQRALGGPVGFARTSTGAYRVQAPLLCLHCGAASTVASGTIPRNS